MAIHSYRSDIDGLRAIAVLSVVVHHLSAALLPGGFVGVDIFFVISGFLITSHIYKESRDGVFSIKNFYQRRINRIVPALSAVVFFTVLFGVVFLSPADLVRLGESSVLSLVGFSNIYFWKVYGNYFSGNASEAPLLHTWSLGVEEQFYLVWPLLVIFLLRLPRHYASAALGLLTLIFVAVSEIAIGFAASASYYLLPTRFFELMFGGVLSLVVLRVRPRSDFLANFSAFAGLGFIVWSVLFLDKTSSFPGVNAIWPCLGAVLVIWSGSRDGFSLPVLSSRPVVFVGLISYSLYLWHWPMISYLNYLGIEIDLFVGVAVICFSIFMAWASWRFIEVPLRQTGGALSFARVFCLRFAAPLIVVMAFSGVTIKMNGFPGRFDPKAAEFEKIIQTRPEVLRAGCHVSTTLYQTLPNFQSCRLGYDKSDLDGVLVGDSFANHFSGMVDVMAKAEKLAFFDFTMDGCPPILGWDTGKGASYAEKCKRRNEAAFAMIKKEKFKRVILAGSWPKSADAGPLLINSIDYVLSTGASLTLVLNNESILNASSCLVRSLMYKIDGKCQKPKKGVADYFSEIRIRYPNVKIIDPNKIICDDQLCNPTLGSTPLYRDDSHLNDVGSRLLGDALLKTGIRL